MSSSNESSKLKIIKISIEKKSKLKPDEILSEEQIKYIYEVLKNSLKEDDNFCISKSKLWNELSGPLQLKQLNIKQYQFELAITKLLKSNKLKGFTIRNGRSGGICRIKNT